MLTDKVKKLPPLQRLVYWIKEREKVRLLKESRAEKPWTDDQILQSFRFCNVRRMDDKVSKWLLQNWYKPQKDHPNMLAAVALARFINKPDSLKMLTQFLFHVPKPDWKAIKNELQEIKANGETVFSGAYMVRGNSKKYKDKIDVVVEEYVRPLWDAHVQHPTEYINGGLMWLTHAAITTRYGFGSFMAGQIVADLRWAVSGDWDDRKTWAPMGPGSARGLARLTTPVGKAWGPTNKLYLKRQDVWKEDFKRHVLDRVPSFLPGDLAKRLEAMDYQNCLCEFDKYERALWGEGTPKQRYPGRE